MASWGGNVKKTMLLKQHGVTFKVIKVMACLTTAQAQNDPKSFDCIYSQLGIGDEIVSPSAVNSEVNILGVGYKLQRRRRTATLG